jgi:hypothetical protein
MMACFQPSITACVTVGNPMGTESEHPSMWTKECKSIIA